MWCGKDRRHDPERLADQSSQLLQDLRQEERAREKRRPVGVVGEFLKLGDELLQTLKPDGPKEKNRRRYYAGRKKEATN